MLGVLIHYFLGEIKVEATFFLDLWGFIETTPSSLHKLLSIFGNGKKKQEILLPFEIKFLCLQG